MDGCNDEPVIASDSRAYGTRCELLSGSTKDFSLVCGGPLYKFFLRIGLVKPPLHRIGWRMVVITLIAWAPLLLLATLSGCLVSGVRVPFLYDVDTQIRLLIVLPLLIGAEIAFNRETRILVPQFLEQRIITPAVLPKFESCVEAAAKLKNSPAAEAVLLALVVIVGAIMWRGLLGDTREPGIPRLGGQPRSLTCGLLVRLRQLTNRRVHLSPMVFPVVPLDEIALADLTDGSEFDRKPS